MDLCDALVDTVAVIPRERGEYTVYLRLPSKVADAGVRWLDIVNAAIDKLTRRNCCNGATRAYEFYQKVHEELLAHGY
jgi:hypothetical protein